MKPALRWSIVLTALTGFVFLGLFLYLRTSWRGPDLEPALRQALTIAFAATAALIWLCGVLLGRNLTAAIASLADMARRIGQGDLAARAAPSPQPELADLARALNAAAEGMSQQAEAARREARYYAAILQQMDEAVVIVDGPGRVQFVNAAFARLFGIDEQAAQGRSSEQIALNYDLSALLLRAMQQNAVQHDEVRVSHPSPRSLATVVTPLLDEQSQTIGAVAVLHDLTELRRLDEVRREFVANASHELRTPAAGIKALAEALQMGAWRDPEKGPHFVQQIVAAADRLTAILDDMLTLTRVERGRQLLNPEALDVPHAVQEVVAQLRLRADGKQIDLRAEVAPGDTIHADPQGLHTVLLNLVDNALKYTPEGGTVTVGGRAVTGGYELSVRDTGVGIPAAHQGRIFERFYRVDKARDRATGGTGLGLAIVKHIVEAHGGRVAVVSSPAEGSTFSVFFPAPPGGDA